MDNFLHEHNPPLSAVLQFKAEALGRRLRKFHVGKAAAIISKRIEASLGVTGVEVRAMVSHLRANGLPICSSGQGYWYAATAEEIDLTIAHLDHRRTALEYLIRDLESCKRRMAGQK